MATSVKLGEEVTIGTTPTEYLINETNAALSKPFQNVTVTMLSTNSGTIQFGVGETPPAANHACSAGEKFVIEGVQNGLYNIWAVASGSGQKFVLF